MAQRRIFQDYVGSVDFNVGLAFSHDDFAFALYDTCTYAGIPFPIDFVFGSPPCVFQGGRAAPFTFEQARIDELLSRYAAMGTGVRLTFSNTEITEEILDDAESNDLLARLNEGEHNGAIVSNDLLAAHIRENYPNLQLVSSLVKPTVENTLGQETPEYYNKLFDLYDIIVVNSAFAYDDAYLAQIEHPGRVEFIANHRCRPNCPLSARHYITQTRSAAAATSGNRIAQRQLEGKLHKINQECLARRHGNPLETSLITTERIAELVEMGFVHYKLEGRDYAPNVLARDIGDWIFDPQGVYLSMIQSIFGQPL